MHAPTLFCRYGLTAYVIESVRQAFLSYLALIVVMHHSPKQPGVADVPTADRSCVDRSSHCLQCFELVYCLNYALMSNIVAHEPQWPGVEDVLTADLSFVYLASRFLEFVSPELGRLSIAGVLADMRSSMIDETDFTKEAANVEVSLLFL